MNIIQLDALRKELNIQRETNEQNTRYYKNIIGDLLSTQNNIKPNIPDNQFNKVNEFLNNMNRDIKSSESTIGTWKPGS